MTNPEFYVISADEMAMVVDAIGDLFLLMVAGFVWVSTDWHFWIDRARRYLRRRRVRGQRL